MFKTLSFRFGINTTRFDSDSNLGWLLSSIGDFVSSQNPHLKSYCRLYSHSLLLCFIHVVVCFLCLFTFQLANYAGFKADHLAYDQPANGLLLLFFSSSSAFVSFTRKGFRSIDCRNFVLFFNRSLSVQLSWTQNLLKMPQERFGLLQ